MREDSLLVGADPTQINMLHALAPTLDGLFSVTVKSGSANRVLLTFDIRRKEDVLAICVGLHLEYNDTAQCSGHEP